MLTAVHFRNDFEHSLEIAVKIVATGTFAQFNKTVQRFFLPGLITVYQCPVSFKILLVL